MSRHALRITPLVAGLLFLVLAGLFALDAGGDADVDARWVPATVLIGFGLALVLGGLQRSRRAGDRSIDPSTTPTTSATRTHVSATVDADRTEPVPTTDARDEVAASDR